MTSPPLCLPRVLATIMLVVGLVSSTIADEPARASDDTATTDPATTDPATTDPATTDVGASEASAHPLAWTFRYAKSRADYIRKNVRDYSCRLIKRERIDGELQQHQFIKVQMRCEQKRDGLVEQPMAVFMQYLAPRILEDRRVLYVAGQNDGMMLVRKGGRSLKYLKLEFDPKGSVAKRESNHPITDIGFDKVIGRLIERVSNDIKNDPTAVNTEVAHFRNAKVGDRICTHIQVVHPNRGDGIEFHRASLYIDDKLHVPIRLVVHDFPPRDGQEPPLLEEYIYVNLKLNVGLSDADFSETRLDSPSDAALTTSAKLSR